MANSNISLLVHALLALWRPQSCWEVKWPTIRRPLLGVCSLGGAAIVAKSADLEQHPTFLYSHS